MIVEGFEIWVADDAEVRIRDTDLGARLGYEQPRDIRKLIGRLRKEKRLSQVAMRAIVARMRNKQGERSVTVNECWLTREQALIVCMRSDTKGAAAVQDAMVAVLLRVFDGAKSQIPEASIVRFLLLPAGARRPWDRARFDRELTLEVCRAVGIPWDGNGKQPGGQLGRVWEEFYKTGFSKSAHAEMKARIPYPKFGDNLWQTTSDEGEKVLKERLETLRTVASISKNKSDFFANMKRAFGKSMLQLVLVEEMQ